MYIFIIDTNFFVNLQRSLSLGKTKEEVVETFVKKFSHLSKHRVSFITTPSAMAELETFFSVNKKALSQVKSILTIQSPSTTTIEISAVLFAELVKEIGKRLYKGLRTTEDVIRKTINDSRENKKELAETYINDLRKRYRKATREGFLDSTTDLDLILLAKDTNGTIVTSDIGLIHWARRFGCKETLPEDFVHILNKLL